MKRAIITGVSGQDGQYLSRHLLSKGYEVIGLTRDLKRADGRLQASRLSSVKLHEWHPKQAGEFLELLQQYDPVEVYNLAAFSSGAGMFDQPVAIGEVNGLSVATILECLHQTGKPIRFLQASSREIFGDAADSPQNELTVRRPRSPYGAAKQYADEMVRIYREHYGMFAASAILFNHDSPLRGSEFVTRKVTTGAARIKLGLQSTLSLGDMTAHRDWGFAGDYVQAMWMMLQQPNAEDFVIASGLAHTVQDLCEIAFTHLGLDFRDHIRVDSNNLRASEGAVLVGDISKARQHLGWQPQVRFKELVTMMVDADLQQQRNEIDEGSPG